MLPTFHNNIYIHYSSVPHHRLFKKNITTGLEGVGFKSTVLGGGITADSKTGGDDGVHKPLVMGEPAVMMGSSPSVHKPLVMSAQTIGDECADHW
jgi:hypothetical protein